MLRLLISLILNGVSIYIGAYLLSGVDVRDFLAAVIAGIILTLANLIVKPILTIITLPITVLTLGLFLLIINGLMVLLADWLVAGFEVAGLWPAILLSLILWVLNFLYQAISLR
ncbi:MAG: phage holin family protein [Bacteroidota bacterium]|nr:phage holin family protein [Bacteroidota bacterium]